MAGVHEGERRVKQAVCVCVCVCFVFCVCVCVCFFFFVRVCVLCVCVLFERMKKRCRNSSNKQTPFNFNSSNPISLTSTARLPRAPKDLQAGLTVV